MAGNQEKQNPGQKLRQAHIAEIQRAMGYFVNLPAHRHRLHFQRENHAEACNLEKPKIGEAEYREAFGPWVLRLGHYSLLCHKLQKFRASYEGTFTHSRRFSGIRYARFRRRRISSTI